MEDDYIIYMTERLDDIIKIAKFLKASLEKKQTKDKIFNDLIINETVAIDDYIRLKKENELLKKKLNHANKDFSLKDSYINHINWNRT